MHLGPRGVIPADKTQLTGADIRSGAEIMHKQLLPGLNFMRDEMHSIILFVPADTTFYCQQL